jgi:hypothetical protein
MFVAQLSCPNLIGAQSGVLPRAGPIYAVTAATGVYCNANGVLIPTSDEGLLSWMQVGIGHPTCPPSSFEPKS